ncbi:exopolysaccharide biosynthesis polyprenyl glycosylphosphotransferase [Butyrivibrio sp. AE2032]|uniref:exopolysaccharide biosynthesis polyprenyl glycosylphosphotransferase n=1 Tax=Butyrivibrio sp. AE2032 TaxID=1458463 RepID=UPI00054E65CB|nr:exopolysaccharide biosynthesis polyprenyl glycosylphosphotransferase [Butyrivibrio sp. AE2032]
MKNVPNTSRRNSKYVYRFFCAAILTAIATCIFYNKWFNFVAVNNTTGFLLGAGNLIMAAGIYMGIYMIIGKWLHAFTIGVERKSSIMAGQVLTLFTAAVAEIPLSCAITGQFRLFLDFLAVYFSMFLIQVLVVCFFTFVMVDIYRITFPPLRILEIYGDHRDDLSHKIAGLHYKYEIAGTIPASEDEQVIRSALEKYDAALIGDIPSHDRNRLVKLCFEMNKRVYYVPKISDVMVKNSQELNLIDAPLFLNKNNGMGPIRRFVKRAFDLILSLIAAIVASPVMLVTALLIHLEDGGPVFFKQERVTIGGKRFMILKFRSMIVDAEKDGRPHPAGEKDDRITRVGHFIRATRIDELPQLLNIIAGDMSIVGPRPERWEHVELYSKEIPEFVFRLKVKGGLTGYAQVYGKYNTTALDKLKLDLLYITNYSLLLDLQIIFQTVKILFLKESTDGFSEETSQKMHDAEVAKSPDVF